MNTRTAELEKIPDKENTHQYSVLMNRAQLKEPPKLAEWWEVENTGWSGGLSWFNMGGSYTRPLRFNTEHDAIEYALRNKKNLNDSTTKWRYVHTTLECEGNKTVTTKIWTEV